jgi:hypothetical protein
MKKELIAQLFIQFEQAAYDYKGIECWSARELQEIFSYTDWRNFLKVIDKGKKACENAGEKISDHFVEVNKMIDLAKGAQREIEDLALTRYAGTLLHKMALAKLISCVLIRLLISKNNRIIAKTVNSETCSTKTPNNRQET